MASASLRQRAISLLARREHSRAELARKLAAHGPPEEVEATLERMIELGLLCDRRFAEAWVRAKAGRFGVARLRYDLAQRGVASELIEATLEAALGHAAGGSGGELERARSVWQRKFDHQAADPREWARQARFLQGRGFSTAVITKLLKENPDESA